MSKKSSKKGSKKRSPAPETTLVPHRAPNLAELLERAGRGKLSDVQQYLIAGGSPNARHPTEQHKHVPLLFHVAASRHSDAAASIKLLLQAGAIVDATPGNGGIGELTALMAACCVPNNLNAVQALLDGGADSCYQTTTDGRSALHLAAVQGLTDTCRILHVASAGRALELTGKGAGEGVTALLAACSMNQCAVVELLCALGAAANHSDESGNTPLILATHGQDTSLLQFLLQ
jgi:ankyrin repeat protein